MSELYNTLLAKQYQISDLLCEFDKNFDVEINPSVSLSNYPNDLTEVQYTNLIDLVNAEYTKLKEMYDTMDFVLN